MVVTKSVASGDLRNQPRQHPDHQSGSQAPGHPYLQCHHGKAAVVQTSVLHGDKLLRVSGLQAKRFIAQVSVLVVILQLPSAVVQLIELANGRKLQRSISQQI